MNGLNLAQLPAQTQTQAAQTIDIAESDPISIFEGQYNRALKQLDISYTQQEHIATRKTRNEMDILQQKYKIEVAALKNKYEAIPKLQRDEKYFQRLWDDCNQLRTRYSMRIEEIQGSIQPDLQDLQAAKQQDLQKLAFQRQEKLIKLNHVRELAERGIITDPYAALKEQYEIIGYNIPASEFQPKSFREQAREIIGTAFTAMQSGNKEGARGLLQTLEPVLKQLPPNEAEAFRKSTQLSRLTIRKGKEEPKTFAERIIEAKPETRLEKTRKQLGLKPIQQPIYQKNKITDETRVSYDGGKTWQTIG